MLSICHQYPFLVIPFYLHTFCRSQRSTKTEQRNVSHAAESLTGPRDVLGTCHMYLPILHNILHCFTNNARGNKA